MTNGLLNPRLGKHNVIDDLSGHKIRSDKTRKNWKNQITSVEDFDEKHPQLNLRARDERIAVTPTRDRPTDKFVTDVDPNSLNQR